MGRARGLCTSVRNKGTDIWRWEQISRVKRKKCTGCSLWAEAPRSRKATGRCGRLPGSLFLGVLQLPFGCQGSFSSWAWCCRGTGQQVNSPEGPQRPLNRQLLEPDSRLPRVWEQSPPASLEQSGGGWAQKLRGLSPILCQGPNPGRPSLVFLHDEGPAALPQNRRGLRRCQEGISMGQSLSITFLL